MLISENYNDIVALQKKLDEKIMNNCQINTNKADLFMKKKLALVVEIAEFANEQRDFKYWSSKKINNRQALVEEYIDVFHFIISIGNDLNFNFSSYHWNKSVTSTTATDLILKLINRVNNLNYATFSTDVFAEVLDYFYALGKNCNIAPLEIINQYKLKNSINIERQNNNY